MRDHSVLIKEVSKQYGDIIALKNISITIKTGELFGLIGPDGAGKTSLIRILTTLLLSTSGKAEVEGFDVKNNFKKIRRIIGYMPSRFSLYQDLSVEENLSFFASVFGTSFEENYDLIEPIYKHIEPFKKRKAGDLSGGMKQKLALSCALIHKPKVLFLDEPTTGVDAVSRKEFWEMLKMLQNKNITILVSTPYMDEASLCDRIALMQKGEIMSVDTPDNITNQFKQTIFSIKAENKYHLLNDLRNYDSMYSVNSFGQYIHYCDTDKKRNETDLRTYLKSKNHRSVEIKIVKPSIEDCFIELMSSGQSQSANGY